MATTGVATEAATVDEMGAAMVGLKVAMMEAALVAEDMEAVVTAVAKATAKVAAATRVVARA